MANPKYGKGLGREIVNAVKNGEIKEPFSLSNIYDFIKIKNWAVPDTYSSVCLANHSAENHSPTYKKYFISVENGKYKLR